MPPSEECADSNNGEALLEDDEDDDDEEDDDEVESTPSSVQNKNGKRSRSTGGSFSTSPKPGMAAFFHYAHGNRARVEEMLSKTQGFGSVAEMLIQEFRALSQNQRQEWESKALDANVNYKDEMKEFEAAGSTTGRMTVRDPHAPRRNKSAFLIFSMEHRDRIVSENPKASFGEISKLISASFHALSQEQQDKYQQKADEDRQRYQDQMVVYKDSEKRRKESKDESS
ncbi:hypothetical protein ACA910_009234 [Epithemia clementina (nom. ined.)]